MSVETSPRLSLEYVMPTQAQKHVTINETFRRLDALVQATILSGAIDSEPVTPAEGDAYILTAARSGAAWNLMSENSLAIYRDEEWSEIPPQTGFRVWAADIDSVLVFDGQNWVGTISLINELNNLAHIGVGTNADGTIPFAAKLNAALWTARASDEGGTGDLRYTLNKEGSENTLSLLFQSDYSGRVEAGLVGDNDFQIKLSDDGTSWHSIFRATSEHVKIPASQGVSVAAINGDAPGARRNLLINGDFSIAQRGEIFSTPNNGDCTLDRLVHVFDGGMIHELSRQSFAPGQDGVAGGPSHFLRWRLTGTASSNPWIEQRVENARCLTEGDAVVNFHARASRSVSMVCRLRRHFGAGGSPTESLQQATFGLTGDWMRFVLSIPITSLSEQTFGTGHHLSLEFYLLGGENDVDIDLADVQLERGSMATVFDRRNYSEQLNLCQRYFAKTWPSQIAPGNLSVAGSLATSTNGKLNTALFDWRLPVEMRTAPSVVIYSPNTGAAGYIDASGTDIAAAPASISENAICFQSAAYSSVEVARAHIVADAEI
ncbi:MAG: hypothetical protein DHS20C06_04520 [Hyphobacterium sp.]|nr:MAG: hypothetical protein DHS20C06_04520 [Hyphobacterium sp.]